MGELPTVELIDDAFYWIKPAYGHDRDRWIVARRSAGCFWSDREEITPRIIKGPIPPPSEPAEVRTEQQEGGQ